MLDRRREVFEAGGPYEWHYAEALAFGSLLLEGIPVRLSGQDSRRGTFSTRHSAIFDAKTGEPYIPLLHLAEKQARFCVYNSLLSEAAVLGFDYGYSLDYPKMLCLVGGAVRRFCQRRAGHHRSIHRSRGIEMAAAERHRAAPAARLRRPGAGAFQRAARALPAGVRRGQHPGLQPHHFRAVFSRSAPPDEARFRQAAHHHDAEKSAALRAGLVAHRRFYQGRVRGNSRDRPRWGRPKE